MSNLSLQPILALLSQSASGNPSQYMFEKAFERHQLDWRYLSLEVTEDALADAVRGMKALGFRGGNCTPPHDRAVLAHLDRVGPTAQRTGVVNWIAREQDDVLVGDDTQGKVLLDVLGRHIRPQTARIVLFGCGDPAVAMAVEAAAAGVARITVVDRQQEAAARLVDLLARELEYTASPAAWDESFQMPEATNVLVSAVDQPPAIDWDRLDAQALVADLSLDPPRTPLLDEAAERGLTTIDGLEIYIERAASDFRLWTGVDPDRTVIREAVEEYLEL